MNSTNSKPSKTPMVPFSDEFGEYLKQKRVDAGLTQHDLSQFLGYSTPQMVSKWERGLCGPKFADLVKLIKLLKIEESDIMTRLMQEQEKLFAYHIKKIKKA